MVPLPMGEIKERILGLAQVSDEQFALLLADVSDELISRSARAEPNGRRYWVAAEFIDRATEQLKEQIRAIS